MQRRTYEVWKLFFYILTNLSDGRISMAPIFRSRMLPSSQAVAENSSYKNQSDHPLWLLPVLHRILALIQKIQPVLNCSLTRTNSLGLWKRANRPPPRISLSWMQLNCDEGRDVLEIGGHHIMAEEAIATSHP